MVRYSLRGRWTPDEEALLAQLLEERKDWPAIAARLKRSMAAVQRHAELRARTAFGEPRTDQPKPESER